MSVIRATGILAAMVFLAGPMVAAVTSAQAAPHLAADNNGSHEPGERAIPGWCAGRLHLL